MQILGDVKRRAGRRRALPGQHWRYEAAVAIAAGEGPTSPENQVEELESGPEKGWEDIDWVLHHQGLPHVPKIIRTELISRHHDDLLAGHFGIEKT